MRFRRQLFARFGRWSVVARFPPNAKSSETDAASSRSSSAAIFGVIESSRSKSESIPRRNGYYAVSIFRDPEAISCVLAYTIDFHGSNGRRSFSVTSTLTAPGRPRLHIALRLHRSPRLPLVTIG